jgi:hypothetical protein
MGIHAMIRFTVRVAALSAVAALLLQTACTMGPASVRLEAAAPAESGCHEPVPATPDAPDPGHVCCSGDHSPDALLTAAYMTALPAISQITQIPALELTAPRFLITVNEILSSSPPGPFVLRI